jgi:hypothetical protein
MLNLGSFKICIMSAPVYIYAYNICANYIQFQNGVAIVKCNTSCCTKYVQFRNEFTVMQDDSR